MMDKRLKRKPVAKLLAEHRVPEKSRTSANPIPVRPVLPALRAGEIEAIEVLRRVLHGWPGPGGQSLVVDGSLIGERTFEQGLVEFERLFSVFGVRPSPWWASYPPAVTDEGAPFTRVMPA